MKIFSGRVPQKVYKDFIWKSGPNYLLKMYGVNYDVREGSLYVEPVYLPFFTFRREAGQIIIALRIRGEEYANLILFWGWPFYFYTRSSSITLGAEEDE